ncbi:MAG: hypothetical protein H6970_03780 [Gammaproteobacteria bacterium]|nr:hypothetical protein [Gammaproteobacteria bacterium]
MFTTFLARKHRQAKPIVACLLLGILSVVTESSALAQACPSGTTQETAGTGYLGYGWDVINNGFTDPNRAIGVIDAVGNPPWEVTARNSAAGSVLIVELEDFVPASQSLILSLSTLNNASLAHIQTSPDNVTYDNLDGAGSTYGMSGSLGQPSANQILQRLTVTVPAAGARYVKFEILNPEVMVDGVAYTSACVKPPPTLQSCPAGTTLNTASTGYLGYASAVVSSTAFTEPEKSIGAIQAAGSPPWNVSAQGNATGSDLIVELEHFVPGGAALTFSLATSYNNNLIGIETSADNITYTNLGSFGTWGTLAQPPTNQVLQYVNVTVPSEGARYVRFEILNQTMLVDGVAFPAACVEDDTVPVTLASVDSHVTKAGLRVDWTTATETRNVGFHLYGRRQGEMAWRPLTEQLIPSSVIDSLEPQRYSAAVSGDVDELLIEGWDSHGQTERHGPFTVGQSYGFDAVSHAQPIDWAAIAAENAGTSKSLARTRRMSSATTGQADALLWVTEPGIQRISFAALQAAGADFSLAPVAQLALTDDGQGAPRYVLDANANGLFDDGDSLEFVGTIADTLYSGRNAYRLRLDPSQVKAVKNVPLLKARNAAPEVFPDRLVFERQKAYSFTSPIDPWYDQWLTAYGRSASLSRSFALPGYAGGDATLHLTLWGVTDWPGVGDDHHLRVKVNEQTLADFSFDGNRDASRDFTVPEGALTASGNTLTLEAPGDTGFAYDIQAFDGFTVAYARQTQAQDGAWRGTIPTNVTSPVQVSGFQGETVAWKGAQRRVGDGSVILKGAGAWQAADGRALQTPIVQAAIPQPAQTPERGAVDYLIVSHPQFLDTPALTQLAALQESRGYSTAVLDVQSLYAAYSDFAVDPEALRAYLRQARPPFVLLVGGDSYDYRDYLGLASQSFIPTFYAATDSLVTQAPADNRFVDYNDNGIPQAAIGRLPVRTVAELTAVADKLVHYQPPTRAVLAAGPSDGGRQFAQVSEEQAQPLLNRFVTQTFYVDDEGLPNAQAALLQALDQDGALVSYVGHSSFRIWGLNPSHGILLWADDARRLTNPTPHLVTQWGCWNTYFVDPNQDTLANGFLLQDHGAAGVLGATALTDLNLLRDFGTEFFRQYAQQPTLGEALRAAQRRYITGNPKAASALRGFVLLGDPATELK